MEKNTQHHRAVVNASKSAFLIAAPSSSSGKTTVTLGLMQAMVNRNFKVQPFKCGPDYIDPMYHTAIAGRPSYNLDCWMAGNDHVTELFHSQVNSADISIIEGVMGLFDGAVKSEGSAAELSKLLDIPVVLVMDAKAMAYSAAPILHGFRNFDAKVKVAGVIFNKVSGPSHYQYLKDAALDAGVEPLGYMPKDESLVMPSRHLGLTLPDENPTLQLAQKAAQMMEANIDLDKLLQLSTYQQNSIQQKSIKKGNLNIAISRDEAFCFMYQANIDALAKLGDITFFSPLHDTILPPADLVWIPGGYPELFAREISANRLMLAAIAQHSDDGKALIAECGGFMLLGRQLHQNNEQFPMAHVFDYDTTLENMKLTLGYRQLLIDGQCFKGHEFHYSQLIDNHQPPTGHRVINAHQKEVQMPVFHQQKTFASYLHLYLGEDEKMASFLRQLNLNIKLRT
jgi:cobyrinic acid a,c-diamide synthase